MKFLPLFFLLSAASPASLPASRDVSESDLTQLEASLRNLEAEARDLKSAPQSLQRQIEEIREEATYLEVKMRKHRESGKSGTGVSEEELRSLSSKIAKARADLRDLDEDRPAPRREARTVPAGAEVQLRLMETLTTASSEPGDRFEATVIDPVEGLGEIAIPAGSTFEGTVEVVDRPEGRTDRSARMVLAFERVRVEGQSYPAAATVVDAGGEDLETGIGDEKEKVGIAAGVGTILGAVLGGKKGAVVGAVLGGAGVILATEGKDVELPRGTVLRVRLDEELRVGSPSSNE
jgi:hypothetical protein